MDEIEDKHYLTSVTIQSAQNLCFPQQKAGNPFCLLDLTGRRKCTEFRVKTSNPVWHQRLDIVTDFKPKSALLICKDYVNQREHKTIGKVILDLEAQLASRPKVLTLPLEKSDPSGRIENKGEITFQLNFQEIHPKRHHHYSWTEILHINVEDVEGLPLYAQCLRRDSQLLVRTKMGAQQFTVMYSGENDVLGNNGFLFIDSHSMKEKPIDFALVEQRMAQGKNGVTENTIGKGQIPMRHFLKDKLYGDSQVLLNETVKMDDIETLRPIGRLKISYKKMPRETIEKKLIKDILEEYDYDFDGRLDRSLSKKREELFDMLAALMPGEKLSEIKLHLDNLGIKENDFIAQGDLVRFLLSSELHAKPLFNLLVISSLKGRVFPSNSHLMRGFSYPNAVDAPEVEIMDRYSNKTFKEKIPAYVSLAMKAMKKHPDMELNKMCAELMPRLTARQGWHFDSTQSRTEILPFMALHKIKLDSLEKPVAQFKSFNEFFSRGTNDISRPSNAFERLNIAICPTDCRLTAFKDIGEFERFRVKGKGLNIRTLLCNETLSAKFFSGSVVLCRLAPRDPHSWCSPINGIQSDTFTVEGEMRLAHPLVGGYDSLDHCRRVVSEIVSEEFGSVLLVAVGGPMVNSVKIETRPMQEVARGERHGKFCFGGSTLLLFFRQKRIDLDVDLLRNSKKGIETFVKRNDRIGIALKSVRNKTKYL